MNSSNKHYSAKYFKQLKTYYCWFKKEATEGWKIKKKQFKNKRGNKGEFALSGPLKKNRSRVKNIKKAMKFTA